MRQIISQTFTGTMTTDKTTVRSSSVSCTTLTFHVFDSLITASPLKSICLCLQHHSHYTPCKHKERACAPKPSKPNTPSLERDK